MISVNEIFREIVNRVSKRYGNNVSYMFGDWDYISDQLTLWSRNPDTSKLKFPIVCLYSPYKEDRGKKRSVSLNLLICVNTRKEYTNEQREEFSFAAVLRPIYDILIDEINKDGNIESVYDGAIPHVYSENYRYGRVGVYGSDKKPFKDFIDGIDIENLELTLKTRKCYGERL